MRLPASLAIIATLVAAAGAAITIPSEASACGGCMHSMNDSRPTQVTAHRMILSVSTTETTLWDQIEYSGEPSEFAWILPIHGQVEVGVSSDLLFTTLANATAVTVVSPSYDCGQSGPNGGGFGTCSTGETSSAPAGGGGREITGEETVKILQQSVVGPYEQVQLSSASPNAVHDWLVAHDYAIPDDVAPIIDAYIAEGFDFLAVRLVPGEGIKAMQPIRITSLGASLALPLRMVGAGTGAFTALNLWVLGEGRYESSSMPNFTIDEASLVWNWQKEGSNYAELRDVGLQANGGAIWLTESAAPYGRELFDSIVTETTADPIGSGYAGDAVQSAQDDVDRAIKSIASANVYVSRLYSFLPHDALAADLTLGAAARQTTVPTVLNAPIATGKPSCVMSACGDGEGGSGGSGGGGSGDCSCRSGGSDPGEGSLPGFAALVVAAGVLRLRRPRV